MTMDYAAIGLKAGLEIHQQVEGKKLFCSCPTTIIDDAPDFCVKRELRASAGETGEVDIAASHEISKRKHYVYEGYQDTTCLVELDEEPPHGLNREALEASLQMAKLLDARIVEEIQVMRKTVVDGSNTSGFQRTALVARNGELRVGDVHVSVPTLCLEEDACRIISRKDQYTVYRLDRLGIPLIEIATGPDLRTPQHVHDVAAYLGMLLRSTGKAKRGLGTIRQDVNVSVSGGTRVEIKGAQDLHTLGLLVETEAKRQSFLISLKDKPIPALDVVDVSAVFKSSKSKILGKTTALAVVLPGWGGVTGKTYAPGRRFGKELAEYAQMRGVNGLVHGDEDLSAYQLSQKEQTALRKKLRVGTQDNFILIADTKSTAQDALQAVIDRIRIIPQGVPAEVRKANEDGTSSYLRPMPGAARMYPETDVKPVRPDTKDIALPELIPAKIKRFQKKFKLSEDLAGLVVKHVPAFEETAKIHSKLPPSLIAEYFVGFPRELKKRYGLDADVAEHASLIFHELEKGTISKDAILDILFELAQGKPFDPEAFKQVSDDDLEGFIKQLIAKQPGLSPGAYMGDIMKRFKGKADGKKAMELLKKHLK